MPPFSTREELENLFIERGSQIMTYIAKNGKEVTPKDPPGNQQRVVCKCANNPEHEIIGMVYVLLTSKSIEKTGRVLCKSCSCLAFPSVEALQLQFKERGSEILSIIGGDGEELPVTFVPSTKNKVKWVCANNETHINISTLGSIIADDRDQYLCRRCAISIARGGTTYESFSKLLQTKDWKMLSDRTEFTGSMSRVKVSCDKGHTMETTYNRFSNDHGCAECAADSKRARTIDDVRDEFEQKGFTLLSKTYVNNATNLDYVCKCGREGQITYNNFIKNIDGCMACTRRWTYQEAEDYIYEMDCELIAVNASTTEEFVLNASCVSFICSCETYHETTWRMFKKGARCPECTKEAIKETCMQIYGVDNPFKSEEIKEKIKKRMLERHGKEYAMQIKEFADQSKQTNIDNHGGVFNLNLPEMREKTREAYESKYGAPFGFVEEHQEKARQTNRKKLGVDYPLESNEIHAKIKKNNKEKYGNEVYLASETGKQQMLEMYGSECYLASDDCKKQMLEQYGSEHYVTSETSKKQMLEQYGSEYYINSDDYTKKMVERYGVTTPMHCPELLSKALYTAFSTKDYVFPSGNIVKVQGYEPFALNLLLEQGVKEDDIVVGCKNVPRVSYFHEQDRIYYPDIYIKSTDTLIEIKSMYTYQRDHDRNIEKFKAAASQHNFKLWVFSPTHFLLMEGEFWGDLFVHFNNFPAVPDAED